jgi:hypothetical protein
MKLNHDGTVELNYIDWMKNLRCSAKLRLDANNALQIVKIQEM